SGCECGADPAGDAEPRVAPSGGEAPPSAPSAARPAAESEGPALGAVVTIEWPFIAEAEVQMQADAFVRVFGHEQARDLELVLADRSLGAGCESSFGYGEEIPAHTYAFRASTGGQKFSGAAGSIEGLSFTAYHRRPGAAQGTNSGFTGEQEGKVVRIELSSLLEDRVVGTFLASTGASSIRAEFVAHRCP
ncbi:MAG: hypothetical protein OEY14_06610, partial [Myxococcales bacterium]|nr:hypothetical protein [Myxococcales bacterium]